MEKNETAVPTEDTPKAEAPAVDAPIVEAPGEETKEIAVPAAAEEVPAGTPAASTEPTENDIVSSKSDAARKAMLDAVEAEAKKQGEKGPEFTPNSYGQVMDNAVLPNLQAMVDQFATHSDKMGEHSGLFRKVQASLAPYLDKADDLLAQIRMVLKIEKEQK